MYQEKLTECWQACTTTARHRAGVHHFPGVLTGRYLDLRDGDCSSPVAVIYSLIVFSFYVYVLTLLCVLVQPPGWLQPFCPVRVAFCAGVCFRSYFYGLP